MKTAGYMITCALITVLVCPVLVNAQQGVHTAIQEGKSFLLDGKYDEAVSAFSRALSELGPDGPESCVVYLGRGQAYFGQGRLSESFSDVNRVLDCLNLVGEIRAAALQLRGSIYLKRGKGEQALQDLTSSIKIFPQSKQQMAITFATRGLVLLNMDEYGRAQGDLRKAIELDPELPMAYAGLAMAYHLDGKPKRAKRAAEKALTLNPDSEAAKLAGEVLADLGGAVVPDNTDRQAGSGPREKQRESRERTARIRSQPRQPQRGTDGRTVSVPIRTDGHVWVQLSFGRDGEPYWFVLDTGATHTVMRRSLLKRILDDTTVTQVGRGKSKYADGSWGQTTIYLVREVYLEGLPLGNIVATVPDEHAEGVPNLLGARSIENVTVNIDTAARTVTFSVRGSR